MLAGAVTHKSTGDLDYNILPTGIPSAWRVDVYTRWYVHLSARVGAPTCQVSAVQ